MFSQHEIDNKEIILMLSPSLTKAVLALLDK